LDGVEEVVVSVMELEKRIEAIEVNKAGLEEFCIISMAASVMSL
jgi:hypothetical protein